MKKNILPLANDKIRLRLVTHEDLCKTLQWRNRPEIRKWFNYSDEITVSMHLSWWESYLVKPDDYVFIIEDNGFLKSSVGQVAVYNIDFESKSAEYGRCMIGDKKASGKNLLYHASMLLFQVAKKQLGLAKLYLQVKHDNSKAAHVYGKLGFNQVNEDDKHIWMEKVL